MVRLDGKLDGNPSTSSAVGWIPGLGTRVAWGQFGLEGRDIRSIRQKGTWRFCQCIFILQFPPAFVILTPNFHPKLLLENARRISMYVCRTIGR